MIHCAGEVRVGKRDTAERRITQNLSRRRLAVFSEEKSWLRTQIGMPPAIQYDACDVAALVKAGVREHGHKLFTNTLLVVAKGSGEHLRAPAMSLLFRGH